MALQFVWNTPHQRRFNRNPRHNIWLQWPGVYWVRFTFYDGPTKRCVRTSLNTKDLGEAMRKRDELVAQLLTPEGLTRFEADLRKKDRYPNSRAYGQWRRRQGLPPMTRERTRRHSASYLAAEKARIAAWRLARGAKLRSTAVAA